MSMKFWTIRCICRILFKKHVGEKCFVKPYGSVKDALFRRFFFWARDLPLSDNHQTTLCRGIDISLFQKIKEDDGEPRCFDTLASLRMMVYNGLYGIL